MAPVIGVARCSRLNDYLDALREAGAEPRILGAGMNPEEALTGLHGLLLTGGADVDPRHYSEAPHPRFEPAGPERDEFELEIVRRAAAVDLPIYGICRGVQVMNVALGGSLVQDIGTQIANPVSHSIASPKDALAHEVTVTERSLLARLLPTAPLDACGVNSRHHQAVKRVAPGFTIVATAPDGVIEAIERPGRFCLGVQWHPENFWQSGRFRALFEAFVRACRD